MSDLPPSKHESVQGLDSGSVEGHRDNHSQYGFVVMHRSRKSEVCTLTQVSALTIYYPITHYSSFHVLFPYPYITPILYA